MKKKKSRLLYILSGGILKEDFVIKHTRLIILIVVLLVFYIGNRYTCLLKLREIDNLQKELLDVKYESIHESGQLTGSNRMSQIEQLVKSQGLEIESAKSPPYIIRK
ncbi:MAG: hypothetical protein LBE79_03930 [Tannerella sp.]|nr:hypothetical protein [Tannerella sp.]